MCDGVTESVVKGERFWEAFYKCFNEGILGHFRDVFELEAA